MKLVEFANDDKAQNDPPQPDLQGLPSNLCILNMV